MCAESGASAGERRTALRAEALSEEGRTASGKKVEAARRRTQPLAVVTRRRSLWRESVRMEVL